MLRKLHFDNLSWVSHASWYIFDVSRKLTQAKTGQKCWRFATFGHRVAQFTSMFGQWHIGHQADLGWKIWSENGN